MEQARVITQNGAGHGWPFKHPEENVGDYDPCDNFGLRNGTPLPSTYPSPRKGR